VREVRERSDLYTPDQIGYKDAYQTKLTYLYT
jgi:hypothetical protein